MYQTSSHNDLVRTMMFMVELILNSKIHCMHALQLWCHDVKLKVCVTGGFPIIWCPMHSISMESGSCPNSGGHGIAVLQAKPETGASTSWSTAVVRRWMQMTSVGSGQWLGSTHKWFFMTGFYVHQRKGGCTYLTMLAKVCMCLFDMSTNVIHIMI
jgi:hypothetical protein